MKPNWFLAVVLGVVIGVVGLRMVGGGKPASAPSAAQNTMRVQVKSPAAPAARATTAAKVTLRDDDPARGPADAKVTLVLFSDFECPFCRRMEPTLERVLQTWPDSVRVVWKHAPLPMHRNAMDAAIAAEAARVQGKFWPMHDKLFENQAQLSLDTYERAARELGLDVEQFRSLQTSAALRSRVQADASMARDAGANGTPTLFVNCRRLVGAQPFEAVRAYVEDELKKAEGGAPMSYEERCSVNIAAQPRPPASSARASSAAPVDPTVIASAVRADDPVRGPRSAAVTLLVFSDFECPFCSRSLATLNQVEKTYPSDVRIVWKHQPLPFHANAVPAALAAEAARQQGKFWEMHDKLFEARGDLSAAALQRMAAELKLDVAKFNAAMADHDLKARIDEDRALAEKLGVTGTPTIFVGAERVVGAQPFEAVKPVIDRAIAAHANR